MPDVFGNLNKVLADREYLEGGEFTVADVAGKCCCCCVSLQLPAVTVVAATALFCW